MEMATVVNAMSIFAFRERPKKLHYRRTLTEYSNSKHLQYRKAFKLRINSCWGQRSIVGEKRVEEIVKQAKEMMRKSGHGGPPRWFTPLDCGKPLPNAPLLLYLPGKKDELQDKVDAHHFYLRVKGEVDAAIAYLLQKREEDPYRHFLPRFLYEAASGFTHQMPTFDP